MKDDHCRIEFTITNRSGSIRTSRSILIDFGRADRGEVASNLLLIKSIAEDFKMEDTCIDFGRFIEGEDYTDRDIIIEFFKFYLKPFSVHYFDGNDIISVDRYE